MKPRTVGEIYSNNSGGWSDPGNNRLSGWSCRGWDIIGGTTGKKWIYNGATWISFGIGYQFLRKS